MSFGTMPALVTTVLGRPVPPRLATIGRFHQMNGAHAPAHATRWLNSQWDFIGSHLPEAPARVIDLGCGPHGGFVPALRQAGYDALGVDPKAPQGDAYHRLPFEQFTPPWAVDAIIACTSLHHTHDLTVVFEHIASALEPDGVLVVIEWDWQRFDEHTARWCFDRLTQTADPSWLHRHRDRWRASGQSWQAYLESWAEQERLHTGTSILDALMQRFVVETCSYGPFFYADLADVSRATETAAIAAGALEAAAMQVAATTR
jgi:SAM-dependent methyltransferase